MAAHCPITREEFRASAAPVKLLINDKEVTAEVKEFSTGSLGWYVNAKVDLMVGDKKVTVQVGANLAIVGSKSLPKSGEAGA